MQGNSEFHKLNTQVQTQVLLKWVSPASLNQPNKQERSIFMVLVVIMKRFGMAISKLGKVRCDTVFN